MRSDEFFAFFYVTGTRVDHVNLNKSEKKTNTISSCSDVRHKEIKQGERQCPMKTKP